MRQSHAASASLAAAVLAAAAFCSGSAGAMGGGHQSAGGFPSAGVHRAPHVQPWGGHGWRHSFRHQHQHRRFGHRRFSPFLGGFGFGFGWGWPGYDYDHASDERAVVEPPLRYPSEDAGVPAVAGIRAAPVGRPTIYVVESETGRGAGRVRKGHLAHPSAKVVERDRSGHWRNAPSSEGQFTSQGAGQGAGEVTAGARVVTVRVP